MLMFHKRRSGGLDVDDVFSVDAWEGTGTARSITNGIDLSNEGGLVWIKRRDFSTEHALFDTVRGVQNYLQSSDTDNQSVNNTSLTAFNNNGFSLGGASLINGSGGGTSYIGWTFRQSPRFFDVVSYTGNAAVRTISHNLGVTPGMMFIKRYDDVRDWIVYHKDFATNQFMILNSVNSVNTSSNTWNNTAPTDSVFTLGTASDVNISGGSFVAYLFANDTDSDGVIRCGSYTGNGNATGPSVNLGWQPQFLMIKNTTNSSNWYIWDSVRDNVNPNTITISANLTNSEANSATTSVDFLSTGFQIKTSDTTINRNSNTFIYMAIRA